MTDEWSGPAPINVLTGMEAVKKRPYLYVGKDKDNGLNVVKEAIRYAIDVVHKGGEAFIVCGDGSYASPFIVRTFEDTELDLEKMFEFSAGKPKDLWRYNNLCITLALCTRFDIQHFTKTLHKEYHYESGKLVKTWEQPVGDNVPGIQLRMQLDLNIVERIPCNDLLGFLAKNPHFYWTLDIDTSDRFPIFRGKI